MTNEQYLRALKRLDLGPASQRTARLLGLSIRQLIRIGNDQTAPSETLALLLKAYLRHGLPKD